MAGRSIGSFFDDLFDRLSRLGPSDGDGGGPSFDRVEIGDHDVEEALQYLKVLIIGELKRRGLWTAPPAFVGQRGSRWLEPGVLDEFTHDAYRFVLVERLGSLLNARKLGKKTGWRVENFVRFFITERQKEADPIGYRVFGRLKAAVRRALERGFLFLFGAEEDLDDEPELDNASCLTYRQGRFLAAAIDRLRDAARFLNDRLLPNLVTDEGRSVPKLIERFADGLEELGGELEGFRLGEMGKEQKDDARKRFGQFGLQTRPVVYGDGPPGDDPSSARPLTIRVEGHEETLGQWSDRRHFLLRQVSDRIDNLPPGPDRQDLWTLWTFLKGTRLLDEAERSVLEAQGLDDPDDPGLDRPFPSQAELQRRLGLSRRRLPKLLEQLQALVSDAVLRSGQARRLNGNVPGRLDAPTVSSPPNLQFSPSSDDADEPRS